MKNIMDVTLYCNMHSYKLIEKIGNHKTIVIAIILRIGFNIPVSIRSVLSDW